MPHTPHALRVKIWPNKEADIEEVELAAGSELTLVEDWGELLLVRDAAGRTFQLKAAQVAR